MNHSTEGVTLWAAFVQDILKELEHLDISSEKVAHFYSGHNIDSPYNLVPMQVYNNMCQWVEEELGEEAIIQIGKNVGETAHGGLVENGIISDNAFPLEVMEGLTVAASSMIQDPADRGWEIENSGDGFIDMKRTQTFNSKLQFGLLTGLMEKCQGIEGIEVSYVTEVAKGDEFDVYRVTFRQQQSQVA